jgi:hypothetical protein
VPPVWHRIAGDDGGIASRTLYHITQAALGWTDLRGHELAAEVPMPSWTEPTGGFQFIQDTATGRTNASGFNPAEQRKAR